MIYREIWKKIDNLEFKLGLSVTMYVEAFDFNKIQRVLMTGLKSYEGILESVIEKDLKNDETVTQ